MKNSSRILIGLLLTLLSVTVNSEVIDPGLYKDSTINCTMPTEREDGTPITPAEIAGVIFYWGNSAGDYQMSSTLQPACQYIHPNIPNTTTYFVGVVEDTEGRMSRYSEEIILQVGGIVADPKPMTGMTITPNRAQE
jgi:hypothetical protein